MNIREFWCLGKYPQWMLRNDCMFKISVICLNIEHLTKHVSQLCDRCTGSSIYSFKFKFHHDSEAFNANARTHYVKEFWCCRLIYHIVPSTVHEQHAWQVQESHSPFDCFESLWQSKPCLCLPISFLLSLFLPCLPRENDGFFNLEERKPMHQDCRAGAKAVLSCWSSSPSWCFLPDR